MAAQEGSSGKKHEFEHYNDKELETLIKSIRVYDEEPSSFIGLFKAIYKRDPNTEEMLDYLDSKNINKTYSYRLCSNEPKVHLLGGAPGCYHCDDFNKDYRGNPKYDLDSPEEIPEKIYGNVNDDCSICYDEPSTEILPCGHRYGKNCIPELINSFESKCQLCRKPFTMDEVLTDPNAQKALAKAKQKALEEQKKALAEQKALEEKKALAEQFKRDLAEQQARTGLLGTLRSAFGYGGGKKTRRRRKNKKMTRKNKTKRATRKTKSKKSRKNKSKRK